MTMRLINMWNRFIYTPSFNIFDVVSWCIVIQIATTYSYWWFLLYFPTIFFSTYQQMKLEKP